MNEMSLWSAPVSLMLGSLVNCGFCSWWIYSPWTQCWPEWGDEVAKTGVTPSIFLGSPELQLPDGISLPCLTLWNPSSSLGAPGFRSWPPRAFLMWPCEACHTSLSRTWGCNKLYFLPSLFSLVKYTKHLGISPQRKQMKSPIVCHILIAPQCIVPVTFHLIILCSTS